MVVLKANVKISAVWYVTACILIGANSLEATHNFKMLVYQTTWPHCWYLKVRRRINVSVCKKGITV